MKYKKNNHLSDSDERSQDGIVEFNNSTSFPLISSSFLDNEYGPRGDLLPGSSLSSRGVGELGSVEFLFVSSAIDGQSNLSLMVSVWKGSDDIGCNVTILSLSLWKHAKNGK